MKVINKVYLCLINIILVGCGNLSSLSSSSEISSSSSSMADSSSSSSSEINWNVVFDKENFANITIDYEMDNRITYKEQHTYFSLQTQYKYEIFSNLTHLYLIEYSQIVVDKDLYTEGYLSKEPDFIDYIEDYKQQYNAELTIKDNIYYLSYNKSIEDCYTEILDEKSHMEYTYNEQSNKYEKEILRFNNPPTYLIDNYLIVDENEFKYNEEKECYYLEKEEYILENVINTTTSYYVENNKLIKIEIEYIKNNGNEKVGQYLKTYSFSKYGETTITLPD